MFGLIYQIGENLFTDGYGNYISAKHLLEAMKIVEGK